MQAKAILALIVCGELVLPFSAWAQTQNRVELRPPSAFATIPDIAARSRALFTEAAKVFMHPRCTNCHPATDRPLVLQQIARIQQGAGRQDAAICVHNALCCRAIAHYNGLLHGATIGCR